MVRKSSAKSASNKSYYGTVDSLTPCKLPASLVLVSAPLPQHKKNSPENDEEKNVSTTNTAETVLYKMCFVTPCTVCSCGFIYKVEKAYFEGYFECKQ